MASYTEAPGNNTIFSQSLGDPWDSGLTIWDVIGTTVTTYWDESDTQIYTAPTPNAQTWTEA